MDSTHYDKIADKLVNFHSKIPDKEDLECKVAKEHVWRLKKQIAEMLYQIDRYAKADEKGWIR